jgi:hypothetical protein
MRVGLRRAFAAPGLIRTLRTTAVDSAASDFCTSVLSMGRHRLPFTGNLAPLLHLAGLAQSANRVHVTAPRASAKLRAQLGPPAPPPSTEKYRLYAPREPRTTCVRSAYNYQHEWELHKALSATSALSQTDGTGQRSSLAIMSSAELIQRKGLGLALCSAR